MLLIVFKLIVVFIITEIYNYIMKEISWSIEDDEIYLHVRNFNELGRIIIPFNDIDDIKNFKDQIVNVYKEIKKVKY
jgi:hypothetical protein